MNLFCAWRCLFRSRLLTTKTHLCDFVEINDVCDFAEIRARRLICTNCVNILATKSKDFTNLSRYFRTNRSLNDVIQKGTINTSLLEIISILNDQVETNYLIAMETLVNAVDLMTNNEFETHDAVFLIKCCGDLIPKETSEVKLEIVRKIMKILIEKSAIDLQHYHAVLEIFKENDCNISAEEFLSSIPQHITPNATTYEKLLECVCNCGDVSQATSIISQMKKLNFPITENIFNALVLAHGRAGDIVNARAVVDTMLTTQMCPTEGTYIALLKGVAGSTEAHQILRILREAETKHIKFGAKGLFEVILQLATAGNDKYIPNILQELQFVPAAAIINAFCIRLICKGAPRAAFNVFTEFTKSEQSPVIDADIYGVFLIKEMIQMDTDIKTLIDICDSLVTSGRNRYAFHVAYVTAVECGSSIALPLIQSMKEQGIELRPHYFWPLIISISKHSGDPGVYGILRAMKNLGVPPDFDTFVEYVFPRLDLSDPVVIFRKLQDIRFSVSELLLPALSYLLRDGQMERCLILVKNFNKTQINGQMIMKPLVTSFMKGAHAKDVVSILKMLKAETNMTSSDESDCKIYNDWAGQFVLEVIAMHKKRLHPMAILNLLKCYRVLNLKISGFAADIIADYFTKNEELVKSENLELLLNELRSSEVAFPSSELFSHFIPHPRDMNMETLENHLLELKSKKMNTRGVLRRLLQGYCRNGNLTRATQILAECENNRVILSPGMQASIFDLHVKTKNLEKAEKVLRDLRRHAPWFKIDEHKIIDYATFLIREGYIKDSIDVLKQYCMDHKVVGGEHISHNCWRLLSTLAETGTVEQTRKVLDELVDLRFCTRNNTILGPLIRAHLNRNDLEGAVNEFVACTENHNCTPLQLELMTHLTKRSETDLLQNVVDSAKKIHGIVSTTTTLVIALASANKKTELRRLLTDSSPRISPAYLKQRCERLQTEGNVQPMEVLAQVCRDLPNLIPDDMYERILSVYCRQNNCEAAVELYNSILENDEKPSTEFLYNLSNFLHNNGHPLPRGLIEPSKPTTKLINKVNG